MELDLSFLHRPADASIAQPWLLVLMHGVGSNEADLFGLASHMPTQFHVLSLRAPNTLRHGSYAWFEFTVSPQGTRSINTVQEAASRELIARVVASAAEQLAVPPERVLLGGFSQGGIMALSLLLTRPALMHGAMVMHSRLLPEVLPLAAPAAEFAGRHLWVSHGLQDNVIPLANAHAVRDHVAALPLALRYAEFPGAHEIRPAELQQAVGWLNTVGQ